MNDFTENGNSIKRFEFNVNFFFDGIGKFPKISIKYEEYVCDFTYEETLLIHSYSSDQIVGIVGVFALKKLSEKVLNIENTFIRLDTVIDINQEFKLNLDREADLSFENFSQNDIYCHKVNFNWFFVKNKETVNIIYENIFYCSEKSNFDLNFVLSIVEKSVKIKSLESISISPLTDYNKLKNIQNYSFLDLTNLELFESFSERFGEESKIHKIIEILNSSYLLNKLTTYKPRFKWRKLSVFNPVINTLIRDYLSKNLESGKLELELSSWFQTHVDSKSGMDNLVYYFYNLRSDLQKVFDRDGFYFLSEISNWILKYGVKEYDLECLDLTYLKRNIKNNFILKKKSGVNIISNMGEIQSQSIHAEYLYEYLKNRKISYNQISFDNETKETISGINNYIGESSIITINGSNISSIKNRIPVEIFDKTYKIGWWTWETNVLPQILIDSFDLVDEIWATSEFTQKTFRKYTSKKVRVCNIPISIPKEFQVPNNSKFEEMKYFFYAFDFMSGFKRKNPLGLVNAYKKAFPFAGEAKLVIKTLNSKLRPVQFEKLIKETYLRNDIILINEKLSRKEQMGLISNAYAIISLHRSEGFGMLLAEGLNLGVPVICTGFSGNMDFTNKNNSILIDYKIEETSDKEVAEYSLKGATWASPNLEMASENIRRLWFDLELRNALSHYSQNYSRNLFNLKSLNKLLLKSK